MPTFERERFVLDCQNALKEHHPQTAVVDIISRAVSNPSAVLSALGTPSRAGIEVLHHAQDLTILNLSWGPGMVLKPHNHEMWAAIGIYGGREENTFFRRADHGLKQMGTKMLECKDVVPLGKSIIHGVRNPQNSLTTALHVYGGDFFETPRSEWDPMSLEEQPYNIEDTRRVFEESNRLLEEMAKASQ